MPLHTAVRLAFQCATALLLAAPASGYPETPKVPITLDPFFSATDYTAARIAPDGNTAVIATRMPDWKNNRFRSDLWLWRNGKLLPLTDTGHDGAPEWSPDGKWIAFTSDRALPEGNGKEEVSRLWLISADGGGARPLYREDAEVHAYAWTPDSTGIYFSIAEPLSKKQQEEKDKQWKDVVRWREAEHGDVLLRMPLAEIQSAPLPANAPHAAAPEPDASQAALPHGASALAHSLLAIDSIVPSPSGHSVAFVTVSVSKRLEKPEGTEIFLLEQGSTAPQQLTHNQALESGLHWSPDGKRLFFAVHAAAGSLEGPYKDVQGRLYSMEPVPGAKPERLGASFDGSWNDLTVLPDGGVIAAGQKGTETGVYRVEGNRVTALPGTPGTYGGFEAPHSGSHLLFVHSAVSEPTEIYLADSPSALTAAQPLTRFNGEFLHYAQPEWAPFTWKADDGASVEGVLLYPPGRKSAKNLPMFTLIHGGPADADGNRFGADWYDWAGLAAAHGWLVFRPNYRGSSGYGDPFLTGISPKIVSRPGKDILEGVDALIKQGIADPAHLAIGGYSYGGYMTDWLITQTHQFKAAVTGAGAIENAANWGFDDETYDDAWYLGGRPWENAANYASEAALFQMNKVTTPTHIVGGQSDIRVSYFEDVLLERALQSLDVPHAFLAFPGEGHSLDKNPWHGYIKVREELNWLDTHAGAPGAPVPESHP